MRKYLVLFAFLALCSTCWAVNTTYYVASGATACSGSPCADTNNGTSKTTAWAHSPGMATCTNTCAGVTLGHGDSVIFRGGDSWTNANFPITWNSSWSGTASTTSYGCAGTNCIYFGVDKTWFAGGSWSRPIFDGQGSFAGANNQFLNIPSGAHFLIIDNIEWTGFIEKNADGTACHNVYICNQSTLNTEIKNNYFHGWSHQASPTADDGACIYGSTQTSPNDNANSSVHDNWIDGTDTSQDMMDFMHGGPWLIYNNYATKITNGLVGNNKWAYNNTFVNFVISLDAGKHMNGIENTGGNGPGVYFNNVIAGMPNGASPFFHTPVDGAHDANFNNLLYNNGANQPVQIDNSNLVTGTGSGIYVFNTTCQVPAANSVACFNGPARTNPNLPFMQVQNTHIIGNVTTISCGSHVTTCTTGNNIGQSNATANGQGYTAAETFPYSPASNCTSPTCATLAAGLNQTSLCDGTHFDLPPTVTSSICTSDTTAGVSLDSVNHAVLGPNRTTVARGSAWDAGAYQFLSTSNASLTPSSVAFGQQQVSTSSSGQTVTLTNTGGATLNIASIAFTGTNAADFSKTTTCGATLAGSASCTITVTFTPGSTGQRSASLVVTDDSGGVGGSTQTTTLTGVGIGTGWTLIQSALNDSLSGFGGTCNFNNLTCTIDASRGMVAVTPGDVVAVTLAQQGSGIGGCAVQATITGVTGGGGGSSYVLPSSTQCYNGVSGAHSAVIGYLLNATTADTSVTVTRSGVAGCNFGISFREFRPPTGTTPTVDNSGCQASAAGTTYPGVGLSLSGTNDAIIQTFSGGAGILSITAPYNTDLLSADHDGSASTVNTSSGAAPTITTTQQATAEASAIAFTAQNPRAATPVPSLGTGVYSTSINVTFTDSTPSSWMCLTFDGSTPVSDHVSNCTTGSLYTGQFTINVTTTVNAIAAAVGFSDSLVSNNVYTLTSPFVSINPSSLTFPSQSVGTSSQIQNVTATNIGAIGLQFSTITTSGDFSETDSCSRIQTYPNGAGCTIAVTFTPTASGTRTGVLTITDNSTGNSGTQQTVALSGVGTSPPNPGMTFKGSLKFKGNITIQALASSSPVAGAPLTYPARTDLSVFGQGAAGELLQSACGGVPACLANAFNPGAATGHQGAALVYTGGPTSVPPAAGTVVAGVNINGLNSYLAGYNTKVSDPDFSAGTLNITRATDATLFGNVSCLGGGNFGVSFTMGTGSSNHWSSDNKKLKVVSTGGSTSILAFDPTTGLVTPSDICGGYMPGGASFSSSDPHMIYSFSNDSQEQPVPLNSSSGNGITPETLTQATTGAHATLLSVNTTFIMVGPVTNGPADNTHIWTGGTSGATFTPNSSFAAPASSASAPFSNAIYQGIICDGVTGGEESVCTKNPNPSPCAANDTNPSCWYIYFSLLFEFNYVASMATDSHFPTGANTCMPADFDANFNGVFSPSADSTSFTEVLGDNGQSNHTGYNGGGPGNGYACPHSPGGVCQGPVYMANYKVGSGCRVFNSMTEQVSGDWGPTGQVLDQQAYLIPGTTTGSPTPNDVWTQDNSGATTQLFCMRNSSNACATSSWTQAYTGFIYGTADGSSTWRDSNGAFLVPSGAPTNAPFFYPDVLHDGAGFPNNQLLSYSLVQQPFIKPNQVIYDHVAHQTTIAYTGGTYSPGQQFIFFNMGGANDSYLNCINPNSCPVFTAVAIPNTGNAVCPGNGSYCPSGSQGSITITDNLGGGSNYTNSESQANCGQSCPTMQPSPQDQNLGSGGFGGQNYWQTQTLTTAADLRSTGHSAGGDHTVCQGKLYTCINALTPWLPATVANGGSSNPACQVPGSPCGSTYTGPLTPPPNNTDLNLLPTSITDDQHGIWGFADGSNADLTPPFFVTTLVCGQGGSGGVGAAACESQYASVWDSEIVAVENSVTRSSPGNLVGADCNYGSGSVGCVYRIAHTFNSDDNWAFSAQNAIANGGITSDGAWIAFPSDWNKTLGCMDLSTTLCWSSWQATTPNASQANVAWSVDGSGNVTITMTNQFCPVNGTQYWYVAKPLPPAGNIQSISCGPTAGTLTLSGFTVATWLNGTFTLGANAGNAWGCDSTTTNAGNCTAFIGTNASSGSHLNSSGTDSGTQKAIPTSCGNGVPCQRSDIWIVKIGSAHQ
jgi:hypothetical protein